MCLRCFGQLDVVVLREIETKVFKVHCLVASLCPQVEVTKVIRSSVVVREDHTSRERNVKEFRQQWWQWWWWWWWLKECVLSTLDHSANKHVDWWLGLSHSVSALFFPFLVSAPIYPLSHSSKHLPPTLSNSSVSLFFGVMLFTSCLSNLNTP